MVSERAMKSVLHNFLETYTSRYSDYDGIWVFGFIVETMLPANIDLMASSDFRADLPPEPFAVQLASTKFREQVSKGRLTLSSIREARLEILKGARNRNGLVNGTECVGWDVLFKVEVLMNSGEVYRREKSIFVARHDSRVECRSTRAT